MIEEGIILDGSTDFLSVVTRRDVVDTLPADAKKADADTTTN